MLAMVPGLFWTAASCPPPAAEASVTLESRVKLVAPGIDRKVNVASATRAPWIDANGWRFRRNPTGQFVYDLPPGRTALAAAETFAYSANAVITPSSTEPAFNEMLKILGRIPATTLPDLADFAFIDDGSEDAGEILNLLTRRNLLYKVVRAPDPALRLNFPSNSDSPQLFAAKVREKLGDDNRSLRVYGSETVICRVQGDGSRARVHLLNYEQRSLEGIRLRIRGTFSKAKLYTTQSGEDLELAASGGFTEFSLPKSGFYAVVDLLR